MSRQNSLRCFKNQVATLRHWLFSKHVMYLKTSIAIASLFLNGFITKLVLFLVHFVFEFFRIRLSNLELFRLIFSLLSCPCRLETLQSELSNCVFFQQKFQSSKIAKPTTQAAHTMWSSYVLLFSFLLHPNLNLLWSFEF